MVRKWLVGIVREAFNSHTTANAIEQAYRQGFKQGKVEGKEETDQCEYRRGYEQGKVEGKSAAMVEMNTKIMEQQAHAWPFFKAERRGKTQ